MHVTNKLGRLSAGIVAAAVAVGIGGIGTASAAGPHDDVESQANAVDVDTGAAVIPAERISGSNRYTTSVEVSKSGFPGTTPFVFIATGSGYADALSVAPAAAAYGGPLLLTPPDRLLAETQAEIERLAPSTILLIGGEQAISAEVESVLATLTDDVVRIAGSDRFDTSRQIASGFFPDAPTVFIATGLDFPDALSAGAAAGHTIAPVILINGGAGALDVATQQLLTSIGANFAAIVGGPNAVSTGIANSFDNAISVIRIAGEDRYETSYILNYSVFEKVPTAYLATGTSYPDALSGAALAGNVDAPLYVVPQNCIPGETLADFDAYGTQKLVLIGGTSALGDGVLNQVAC